MCNIPGQGTPFDIGWYGLWAECPGDEGQVSNELCQEYAQVCDETNVVQP